MPVSDVEVNMIDRGARGQPRHRPLLDRADLAWMLGLMALGAAFRLYYRSGYGLGDDVLFRHIIANLLSSLTLRLDNISYRFTWWFPTGLSSWTFGLNEFGMILPITVTAIAGIGLIYAFGKALWGTSGGIIATSLLLVAPLDVAWSTMLSPDILVSFFSAFCVLLTLRALEQEDTSWKRYLWILAAASLWLAYGAKLSAVLLLPALALICWMKRQYVDRQFVYFLATLAALFGGTHLMFYLLTGDIIFPFHAELSSQGLVGDAASQHRLTSPVFWSYIRWLFLPDQLGDFLFSFYPHLLVLLAATSWFLGIRTAPAIFWWFVFVFLGMQFNIQHVHGVWISGFRNIRHAHVLVYPLILLLTGYLTSLRRRYPMFSHGILVLVLVFSAWQSVATASKTQIAFDDRRHVSHFLLTLPPKTVYSDFQIATWASILDFGYPWKFETLESFDRTVRRAQIAAIGSGYLITGGGREPYYGCIDCIPRADELAPSKWRLIREFPGPAEPTRWRPEPLRLWEVGEAIGASERRATSG
jgi:hypothetical protein